ncbi:hypothetical protein [Streptomyces sp. NPDC059604]|uniref:hypothetical protein n=1 Tax=Streptomyces sp. NPDC059604 TaxID=3346881 RepID=UPI0036CC7E9D
MSIKIRWKNPGNAAAMAREVQEAYALRIDLQDDNGLTPEALVAEEMADAMDAEFIRIHGVSYAQYVY